MAVSLSRSEVADLCIGRPPEATVSSRATVADAFAYLRRSPRLLVVSDSVPSARRGNPAVVGCVTAAGLLCFLAGSKEALADPAAALAKPLLDVVSRDGGVRKIEPRASVLDAVDAILEGNKILAVPVRLRKAAASTGVSAGFCVVTQNDLVRFFLNSISLFSVSASYSISVLNIIRSEFSSVHYSDSALSAIPQVRHAIATGTSVAVITDDGQLVGEIAPDMLGFCDETAVAAIATLSVVDLMSYIDHFGCPHEYLIAAIKSRLKKEKLSALLELMEDCSESSPLMFRSNSLDSSSDDDLLQTVHRQPPRIGSFGRRSTEEPVVCTPGSSLAAVMAQAVANQVNHVWVVDDGDDDRLVGIVTFADMLRVFQEQL